MAATKRLYISQIVFILNSVTLVDVLSLVFISERLQIVIEGIARLIHSKVTDLELIAIDFIPFMGLRYVMTATVMFLS